MKRALRPLLPAAEAALTGLTFVTVFTFWRLFEPGPWLMRLVLCLLIAHVTMIATRRLGWDLWVVAPVAFVTAILTLGWIFYPATTDYLLPTIETLRAAGDDLAGAWRLFQEVRAPAPVATGFLLMTAIAIWAVAFISDWAAFRVWVPFEAVVPAATMFVFASLFSGPDARFVAAAMFGSAVLVFVLLHRVARQQTSAAWLPSHIRDGVGALLGTGGALVAIAIVIAAIFGPFLPGAQSSALLDFKGRGGSSEPRVVISPYVSVASQLNQLSDVLMFTVESEQRSYWRTTSLERFDGTGWSYSRSFEAASGDLPQDSEPAGESTTVSQRFEIVRLGGIFMPAAYRPVAIDDERYPTRWESESATLVIDDDQQNTDGNQYTVTSELPRLDPEVLRQADPDDADGLDDVYLDLPPDFPESIRQQAETVVADAATPYDQARALQDFFRSDQFTYDQTVEPGGSSGAMETFLFETRRGFCQQFAGTFAAMARAVGLPARVAIGFTTGETTEDDPGVFQVSGSNAHAWPEVYLGEYGWVPFEPTPGRGIPGGEGYTGVPEAQAVPGDPATATTARPSGVDDPFEGEIPDDTIPIEDGAGALSGGEGADGDGFWETIGRWALRLLIVVAAVVVVALVLLGGLALARIIGRHRRRRQASEPGDRVRVAWTESVEAAETLGVIWRPWETPAEYARRAQTAVDGGSFAALADKLAVVDYSAGGASEEDAARAAQLARHIASEARHQATREQTLRAWFDPRPPERWPSARKAAAGRDGEAMERVAADAPMIAVQERPDDQD
jgi:transglutaminase-like putative cysteine protease